MAVYAVDFDGTLAITRFPEIIEAKPKIVAAVKLLKAQGHKVILSRLVDTFISKISFPMQPGPEIGSISDA